MVAGLNEDSANYEKSVVLTQKQEGWQDASITDIGGVSTKTDSVLSKVAAGQTIKVTYADSGVTFSK